MSSPEVVGSNRFETILVYRPGAIGDILVTAPAFRPSARHARTRGYRSSAIPQPVRCSWHRGWWTSFIPGIAASRTPYSVRIPSLSGTNLGAITVTIAWMSSPVQRIVDNLGSVGAEVLVAPPLPGPDSILHVAEHLMQTLAPLGVDPLPTWRTFRLQPKGLEHHAAATLDARQSVFLHAGSGSRKNWPLDNYQSLARSLWEAPDSRSSCSPGQLKKRSPAAVG